MGGGYVRFRNLTGTRAYRIRERQFDDLQYRFHLRFQLFWRVRTCFGRRGHWQRWWNRRQEWNLRFHCTI